MSTLAQIKQVCHTYSGFVVGAIEEFDGDLDLAQVFLVVNRAELEQLLRLFLHRRAG